ncbi:MAG: hypothetical protein ACREYC_09410 [Gammaproteobacteria bacterium]
MSVVSLLPDALALVSLVNRFWRFHNSHRVANPRKQRNPITVSGGGDHHAPGERRIDA